MSKPIEMRRCVVCRQVRHKSELLRVVKSAENFSFDETGKAPGRGRMCGVAQETSQLR